MAEWTKDRHQAARLRCEEASEGPWSVDAGVDPDGTPFRHIDGWVDLGDDWMCLMPADAEFIAASRIDLPDALDEIERLTRELNHTAVERDLARQERNRLSVELAALKASK